MLFYNFFMIEPLNEASLFNLCIFPVTLVLFVQQNGIYQYFLIIIVELGMIFLTTLATAHINLLVFMLAFAKTFKVVV